MTERRVPVLVQGTGWGPGLSNWTDRGRDTEK